MIPSRGLRWSSQAIGVGRRRLVPSSARNFSSSLVQHRVNRASPLLSSRDVFLSKTLSNSQSPIRNQLLRNGASIRFASTTPAAVATVTGKASTTPADAVSSSTVSPAELSTPLDFASDFTSDSLYNIPEHIGYLKSLGLDYGWGPTACMEWLLEHVHVYGGTPWWISIGLTALVLRVVLFQPYVGAADNAARLATIKPFTDPITTKMKDCQKLGDVDGVMKARQELNLIHKRAGIKLWKSFVPGIQAFAGYGTFVLLRGMSKLPVPGLETGGSLWFYNLAIPDPYFILPVATAGVLHWVLRKGGETGQSTLSPDVQKAMMYGFPALTLLFTWWLPAALQLSFFISGLLSYIQATLFKNARFRSAVGITPLPSQAGPPSPYRGKMRVAASASAPSSTSPRSAQPRSNPVLSSSELNSRFQASSGSSSPTSDSKAPASRTSELLKKLTKPISDVAETGRAMVAKGNKSMDARRAKGELEERKRYETKRQEELKRERIEKEKERRAERAARKANNL